MDRNEQLFERAQKVIPGGVNSPVRAFRSVGGAPRFIERAKGPHMWDAEGKQYVDYVCSWGPMILGHNHPAVLEALHAAVERGISSAPLRKPKSKSRKRSARSSPRWRKCAWSPPAPKPA